jgi:SAM-dependent methyltransferase
MPVDRNSTSPLGAADRYALGTTAGELRRLSLQDRVFAPHSENLFRQAGITGGLRVLDAGCGTGDTTRLLARIVGPAGLVVGVDRDSRALETARQAASAEALTNVRFIQGDLRALELDEEFDALAGRLILMHLDGPVPTLSHLIRRVRPGGVVTFQEATMGRAGAIPEVPLISRNVEWGRAALRQAGADPEFGDSLPAIFQGAGLPHPGFAAIRIAGDADSLLPEYLTQTMKSLGPMAIAAGAATADEIEHYTTAALVAQTRERQAMIHLQELACAWARRPVPGKDNEDPIAYLQVRHRMQPPALSSPRLGAAGEKRDRVCDEGVGLPGPGAAGGDEHGDALQERGKQEAEPFGVPRREFPGLLPLVDEVTDRGEQPLGRRRDGGRLGGVLGGEHQVQQGGVTLGELHVGGRGGPQARLEVAAGAVDRRAHLFAQALEPRFGEGVEQRPPVGEVPAGGGVADPGLPREVAQRQGVGAPLAQGPLGLGEQRGAQAAMVVRAIGHEVHRNSRCLH